MTNSNALTAKLDEESIELISFLARRKYKYLVIAILIGVLTSLYLKFNMLGYSATGGFYVNDMNILSSASVDMRIVDNISPSDNLNRIYEQVVSSTVKEHLIKKFNLVEHYGVDSTKEFYFQQTGNILSSNISVKKNTFNTIYVTVSDKHRYLAAEIANEIMTYLDKINREYYINNIQQKIKVSEAFLQEIKKDNTNKSRSIDSLLAEMHYLTTSGARQTVSAIYMLQMEQRLSDLISQLSNSTHDLMKFDA
jgi:hypothetical protein